MTIIFDGNKRKEEILEEVRPRIAKIRERGVNPKLAIINVGKNPASLSFIRMKISALNELGLDHERFDFDESVEEKKIRSLISELNSREDVNGIIVQLPLPKHMTATTILNEIDPIKDVDCLTDENLGKIMHGEEELAPCTPKGIIDVLEHHGIILEGREVTIVNNSILIGKPLAIMLTNRFATVTLCHVKTRSLVEHTKRADILITATGVAGLIGKEHIKEGVALIDAGFSRIGNKVMGDVRFEEVKDLCKLITPTPGGIGPMTVAMLIKNLIICAERQLDIKHAT